MSFSSSQFSHIPPLRRHGGRIAPAADEAHSLLLSRRHQPEPKLSRSERQRLTAQIQALESPYLRHSLNFSRTQVETILRSRDRGEPIEFETLGPYLIDYACHQGQMTLENLIAEDRAGLKLAVVLRSIFPQARLVSLYDDYNRSHLGQPIAENIVFTPQMKAIFRQSLIELLQTAGALGPTAIEGQDFLLLAESQRQKDAERLVCFLDRQGFIRYRGEEIFFVNDAPENPLHRSVRLRTASGKWSCVALDASAFQAPDNLAITHIIVLPDYMKDQQDQVWEILRVLGFQPDKYHNLFFGLQATPATLAQVVRDIFLQVP